MSLEALSDVELLEESLRLLKSYPATKEAVLECQQEIMHRGTERQQEAVRLLGEKREAARFEANLADNVLLESLPRDEVRHVADKTTP